MVDPRASRFWTAALQSGLIEAHALNACWEGIPEEKRNAPEHLDRRLARQAVQQSYLTLWQAQQLLAGRTSGFKVDRYLLLDLLGHGGMGRVYLARDTRLGRHVALKILAPERMSNPRAITRFQREARVGAQLQHEHLVRIYDFGESQGRYFLVMEYIEGKTIGALIAEQGPMPLSTAARLIRQVAFGLEHAHRKGLIHRDVNPYNILVTHEGIAKLADLGLAKDMAEEERVTREGATVGTFDYVAPEQARHSHSADIRSDIYSLGCTLYHMISGQVPFPSPSLPEKLFAHQALEPTPLERINPRIPASLVDVVKRMMRKQPADRYATPLEVAQAIEPFVDEYARLSDGQPEPPALIPDDSPEEQTVVAPPVGAGAKKREPSEAHTATLYRGGVETGPAGTGSTPGPKIIPPSMQTPPNDQGPGSVEDMPLVLDLGPEPSLTDSLHRPKSWFGPDRTGAASAGPGRDSAEVRTGLKSTLEKLIADHPWVWPWGVLALIVLATALLYFGGWPTLSSGLDPSKKGTAGDRSSGRNQRPRDKEPLSSTPVKDVRSGVLPAVKKSNLTVLSRDGQESPVPTLGEAISKAIGVQGWVLFHNSEPVQLSAIPDLANSPTGEWLKLRSADGVSAVLEVELKPGQPLLKTGSGLKLLLEGVTIVARVSEPDPKASGPATPALTLTPVIRAAGSVQLRHCTFILQTPAAATSMIAPAIVSDGGDLTVENCWFRDFDTAIAVRSVLGRKVKIERTLATSGTRPASGPGGESSRWMLHVELLGGGRASSPRGLVINHCTVVGDGLMQLKGFTEKSPIQVEVNDCAVQVKTLIGWQSLTPGDKMTASALQWTGKGNLLDVQGSSWIKAAGQASSGSTVTIANGADWSRFVKENDSRTGKLTSRIRPFDRVGIPTLEDVVIESPGPSTVGADLTQVGPVRERIDSASH